MLSPVVDPARRGKVVWAYGVTTVPQRRDDLLPRTLTSLKAAGFDRPRLFVDGADDPRSWEREFGLEVSGRFPAMRTAGSWTLALYELYIRTPNADRYAIFQDDFVTYKNLRDYLEQVPYPQNGYCNLYTFPSNQRLVPDEGRHIGWYRSNQFGRGAVALIFDLAAVLDLLSSRHLTERPRDIKRGHKAIDGGIVDSLRKAGRVEYVHNPSLVQHTGRISSMGSRPHLPAVSFKGEEYDACDLLKEVREVPAAV